MPLVQSLLTAIMRADGDALVMHVGEKPYVVASAGPIELSTQGLNLQAMSGMIAQLLPSESQRALAEFGAVEHELTPDQAVSADRFTVVVARGGDDVWIEIRRHRRARAAGSGTLAAAPLDPGLPAAPPQAADPEPVVNDPPAVVTPPAASASPEPVEISAPEPDVPAIAPLPVATADHTEPEVVSAAVAHEREASASARPGTPGELGRDLAEPALDGEPADAASDGASAGEPEAPHPMAVAGDPEPAPHATSTGEPEVASDGLTADTPQAGPETAAPGTPEPAAAEVIPITRTLRIEVPPAPRSATDRSVIERLLGITAARGATALYLTTDAPPSVRVDADVRLLHGERALSSTDVESAVLELMPETTRESLRRGDPAEWVCELSDIGRVRCSTFRDYRGAGAVVQLISVRPAAAEQLGLTPEIQALATETEGLVIVASPRGQGKTTLVGALVDLINRQRPQYVITLEKQIRLVHEHGTALISQREVRGTPDQMLTVARGALRENPDVLVIEDLQSAEMFQLALDAAGSGLLVFVTLTAASATAALTRIVEMFAADRRSAVQSLIAERLRGAVVQVLLRKSSGGRVAAREVVLMTAAVAGVLADGELADLPLAIESGRRHGLASLNDALIDLVRSGVVDVREAFRKADDRDGLLLALKRESIDITTVERLA